MVPPKKQSLSMDRPSSASSYDHGLVGPPKTPTPTSGPPLTPSPNHHLRHNSRPGSATFSEMADFRLSPATLHPEVTLTSVPAMPNGLPKPLPSSAVGSKPQTPNSLAIAPTLNNSRGEIY